MKSPLDFGGLGDGATDDSAAVAAAAGLGYLWLPPGYTFVTIGVLITLSDFSVFGGGALKLKAGTGTDLLVFDGSQFTGDLYPGNGMYCHISGVTLHGNAANQPVNLGACLVLRNAAYTTVNDCLIYAASGDGIRLENANGCFQADECNILNNRIFSSGRNGIYALPTLLPVSTTIAASIGTTIAANIAVGVHTVTPASMAGITLGSVLPVQNSDTTHFEYVTATAITGSTFTANFASTKTGPGIMVGGSHVVVTPASMHNITVGSTQIVANADTSHLEYVVVQAITPTTFTARFLTTKTGPGITVVSTWGHVGDHVIAFNHANYNNESGIRGTYLTSTIISNNNVLTNATGIYLDAADRCSLLGNAVRNNKGSGVIIDQDQGGHGFGRSKQLLIESNQLHFNNVQTPAGDELDVFHTDGCVILGNYLGDTDFTPVALYGVQLFDCTGIAILGNTFGPTIHGPLLAPVKSTTITANIATGSQTVTPASMVNIINGRTLFVENADGTHSETVTVTGVTGSTFTATFATTKTGPGIVVITGPQQTYRSLGNIGLSDGMQGTLSEMPSAANLPTPTVNDYGILYYVTDYQHVLLWIGTQWVYQLGDSGSGWIVNSVGGALPAGIWQACNGSNATILNGDGTTQVVATPVLAAGYYIRR